MSEDFNEIESSELAWLWQQTILEDTGSFKKIHDILFDGLYLYALKLLESEDLANDAVQDLFIKIWTKRHSIGEIKKIKPYFYTSLRRQILNQLRDLKLRNLKIKLFPQTDIEFSQEDIVVIKEEYAHLQHQIIELLNNLPKRQKEVIYLHFFENLDNNQIATIMKVTYQSVLNLKQKAIQKLRAGKFMTWFLFIILMYHFLKI